MARFSSNLASTFDSISRGVSPVESQNPSLISVKDYIDREKSIEEAVAILKTGRHGITDDSIGGSSMNGSASGTSAICTNPNTATMSSYNNGVTSSHRETIPCFKESPVFGNVSGNVSDGSPNYSDDFEEDVTTKSESSGLKNNTTVKDDLGDESIEKNFGCYDQLDSCERLDSTEHLDSSEHLVDSRVTSPVSRGERRKSTNFSPAISSSLRGAIDIACVEDTLQKDLSAEPLSTDGDDSFSNHRDELSFRNSNIEKHGREDSSLDNIEKHGTEVEAHTIEDHAWPSDEEITGGDEIVITDLREGEHEAVSTKPNYSAKAEQDNPPQGATRKTSASKLRLYEGHTVSSVQKLKSGKPTTTGTRRQPKENPHYHRYDYQLRNEKHMYGEARRSFKVVTDEIQREAGVTGHHDFTARGEQLQKLKSQTMKLKNASVEAVSVAVETVSKAAPNSLSPILTRPSLRKDANALSLSPDKAPTPHPISFSEGFEARQSQTRSFKSLKRIGTPPPNTVNSGQNHDRLTLALEKSAYIINQQTLSPTPANAARRAVQSMSNSILSQNSVGTQQTMNKHQSMDMLGSSMTRSMPMRSGSQQALQLPQQTIGMSQPMMGQTRGSVTTNVDGAASNSLGTTIKTKTSMVSHTQEQMPVNDGSTDTLHKSTKRGRSVQEPQNIEDTAENQSSHHDDDLMIQNSPDLNVGPLSPMQDLRFGSMSPAARGKPSPEEIPRQPPPPPHPPLTEEDLRRYARASQELAPPGIHDYRSLTQDLQRAALQTDVNAAGAHGQLLVPAMRKQGHWQTKDGYWVMGQPVKNEKKDQAGKGQAGKGREKSQSKRQGEGRGEGRPNIYIQEELLSENKKWLPLIAGEHEGMDPFYFLQPQMHGKLHLQPREMDRLIHYMNELTGSSSSGEMLSSGQVSLKEKSTGQTVAEVRQFRPGDNFDLLNGNNDHGAGFRAKKERMHAADLETLMEEGHRRQTHRNKMKSTQHGGTKDVAVEKRTIENRLAKFDIETFTRLGADPELQREFLERSLLDDHPDHKLESDGIDVAEHMPMAFRNPGYWRDVAHRENQYQTQKESFDHLSLIREKQLEVFNKSLHEAHKITKARKSAKSRQNLHNIRREYDMHAQQEMQSQHQKQNMQMTQRQASLAFNDLTTHLKARMTRKSGLAPKVDGHDVVSRVFDNAVDVVGNFPGGMKGPLVQEPYSRDARVFDDDDIMAQCAHFHSQKPAASVFQPQGRNGSDLKTGHKYSAKTGEPALLNFSMAGNLGHGYREEIRQFAPGSMQLSPEAARLPRDEGSPSLPVTTAVETRGRRDFSPSGTPSQKRCRDMLMETQPNTEYQNQMRRKLAQEFREKRDEQRRQDLKKEAAVTLQEGHEGTGATQVTNSPSSQRMLYHNRAQQNRSMQEGMQKSMSAISLHNPAFRNAAAIAAVANQWEPDLLQQFFDPNTQEAVYSGQMRSGSSDKLVQSNKSLPDLGLEVQERMNTNIQSILRDFSSPGKLLKMTRKFPTIATNCKQYFGYRKEYSTQGPLMRKTQNYHISDFDSLMATNVISKYYDHNAQKIQNILGSKEDPGCRSGERNSRLSQNTGTMHRQQLEEDPVIEAQEFVTKAIHDLEGNVDPSTTGSKHLSQSQEAQQPVQGHKGQYANQHAFYADRSQAFDQSSNQVQSSSQLQSSTPLQSSNQGRATEPSDQRSSGDQDGPHPGPAQLSSGVNLQSSDLGKSVARMNSAAAKSKSISSQLSQPELQQSHQAPRTPSQMASGNLPSKAQQYVSMTTSKDFKSQQTQQAQPWHSTAGLSWMQEMEQERKERYDKLHHGNIGAGVAGLDDPHTKGIIKGHQQHHMMHPESHAGTKPSNTGGMALNQSMGSLSARLSEHSESGPMPGGPTAARGSMPMMLHDSTGTKRISQSGQLEGLIQSQDDVPTNRFSTGGSIVLGQGIGILEPVLQDSMTTKHISEKVGISMRLPPQNLQDSSVGNSISKSTCSNVQHPFKRKMPSTSSPIEISPTTPADPSNDGTPDQRTPRFVSIRFGHDDDAIALYASDTQSQDEPLGLAPSTDGVLDGGDASSDGAQIPQRKNGPPPKMAKKHGKALSKGLQSQELREQFTFKQAHTGSSDSDGTEPLPADAGVATATSKDEIASSDSLPSSAVEGAAPMSAAQGTGSGQLDGKPKHVWKSVIKNGVKYSVKYTMKAGAKGGAKKAAAKKAPPGGAADGDAVMGTQTIQGSQSLAEVTGSQTLPVQGSRALAERAGQTAAVTKYGAQNVTSVQRTSFVAAPVETVKDFLAKAEEIEHDMHDAEVGDAPVADAPEVDAATPAPAAKKVGAKKHPGKYVAKKKAGLPLGAVGETAPNEGGADTQAPSAAAAAAPDQSPVERVPSGSASESGSVVKSAGISKSQTAASIEKPPTEDVAAPRGKAVNVGKKHGVPKIKHFAKGRPGAAVTQPQEVATPNVKHHDEDIASADDVDEDVHEEDAHIAEPDDDHVHEEEAHDDDAHENAPPNKSAPAKRAGKGRGKGNGTKAKGPPKAPPPADNGSHDYVNASEDGGKPDARYAGDAQANPAAMQKRMKAAKAKAKHPNVKYHPPPGHTSELVANQNWDKMEHSEIMGQVAQKIIHPM